MSFKEEHLENYRYISERANKILKNAEQRDKVVLQLFEMATLVMIFKGYGLDEDEAIRTANKTHVHYVSFNHEFQKRMKNK